MKEQEETEYIATNKVKVMEVISVYIPILRDMDMEDDVIIFRDNQNNVLMQFIFGNVK